MLRKLMYQFNEEYVDTFPKKPTNGIIEEHIEYCKKLCRVISKDEKAVQLPQISETYISLVEAVEDNIEVLKQSYDDEAKVGHKSADINFSEASSECVGRISEFLRVIVSEYLNRLIKSCQSCFAYF